MFVQIRKYWCVLLVLALFSGCAGKPVRHLASDASLIKVGKSTKVDVMLLLGEPETQQMVSETAERWLYYEEDPSFLQKTPVVGGMFDSKGYGMIRVLFEGDLVVDCKYRAYSDGEYDWSDDFSWQEKK